MNGEVARELGRTVGDDQLTKQAAAVYTEIFEKIASKFGKCAGLDSMEVAELVKEATEKSAIAITGGITILALLKALGLVGAGAGAAYGASKMFGKTPVQQRISGITEAQQAGLDPVQMGLMAPKRKPRRRWGGWGGRGRWRPDYSRFAAGPSAVAGRAGGVGSGTGEAGEADPRDWGPESSQLWARMGINPSRFAAEHRALRDFRSGAELRSQLGRGFSQMAAQQL